MAAPHVSAVAALLPAQGRDPEQVRQALNDTAVNATGDPRLGAGLVDAAAAVALPGAAPAPPASASAASASAASAPAASAPPRHPRLPRPRRPRRPRVPVLLAGGLAVLVVGAVGGYLLGRARRDPGEHT